MHSAGRLFNCYYLNDREGRIAGYAILRRSTVQRFGGRSFNNLKLCSVLDCRALNAQALRTILALAQTRAREWDCHLFETMNSHRIFGLNAKKLGMVKLGGHELAFETPPEQKARSIVKDNWWFSLGESDVFFS